jgi:streptogramin lyase
MMTLAPYALGIGAAVTLLAGCSALQQAQDNLHPPIGGTGAIPQTRVAAMRSPIATISPEQSHAATPTLKEYITRNGKLAYPLALTFDAQANLWFNAFGPYLGKRASSGKISLYKLAIDRNHCGREYAQDFTLGPDHDVWFTDSCGETVGTVKLDGKIFQKDPFTGYTPTAGITTMSRHLWVVIATGYLAELNTNWKVVNAISLYGSGCGPGGVTLGYAKTLWITNSGNCPGITRVTPDGNVANFPVQAKDGVWAIAKGADGNMWFTAADAPKINAWIGKITPDGQITKYPITDQADGIAMGPDGNLWITEPFVGHVIGMNLQGQIVDDIRLPGALNGSQPRFQLGEIIQGPDKNMWFAEGYRNKIGELIFSHR